jgi:hypothetical protein
VASSPRELSEKTHFPYLFLIVISFAACLPSAAIEEGALTSLSNFYDWFLLKTIVLITLNLQVLFFFQRGVFFGRVPIQILILIAGGISGVTTAAIVEIGANILGLLNTESFVERILFNGAFCILWIATIFFAGTNYLVQEDKKNLLLRSFFEIEQTTHLQSIYLEGLGAKYFKDLIRQADATTGGFAQITRKSENTIKTTDEILNLIEIQLGELNKLTESILKSERNLHKMKWSWRISDFIVFLKSSFAERIVPPYILAFASTTTIYLPLSKILPFDQVFLSLITLWAAIFAAQFLIFKFSNKSMLRRLNILTFVIHPLLIVAILSRNTKSILGNFLFSPTLKVLIATTLVLVISLLYHSSRGQFFDSESAIREGAQALSQDTKLALQNRQELTRINKLWLQHIHGTVKSKVYAATLMIEKAETSQTSKIYNESLEKARVLLNSTVELPEYVNQSASSEIEFRISRWVGLVEIDLDIKIDDLDSRIYKPVAYADLIEEGITNAVRHGRCTSIFIEIYENGSGNLVTEVIDNGIYKPSTISGLGSALFESATNGRWSRTRDEELNRTTLRLLT